MTLMEDFLCPNCASRPEHVHSCQNPVVEKFMTTNQIKKLQFYCHACGRVAEFENKLCQPVMLTGEEKDAFVSTATIDGRAEVCQVCGQPVRRPGHICDPKGLPYKCDHCGIQVVSSYHVCKQIIDKAKFWCKDCGRISVSKENLCAPLRL